MNDDTPKTPEKDNAAAQGHPNAESPIDPTVDSKTSDAEVQLQEQINASLQQSFAMTQAESQSLQHTIQRMLDAGQAQPRFAVAETVRPSLASRLAESRLAQVALVASLLLAIGVGILRFSGPNSIKPYFPRQSLAMIFHDSVSHEFRPYYNCEDMNRFADTFESRQGQRLTLAQMPAGTKMLGLSYLGGISRDTTAMLATVKGQQVIVFIDTLTNASGLDAVTAKCDEHPQLNTFVVEKHGLVFAEVSALESAQVLQHIVPEQANFGQSPQ